MRKGEDQVIEEDELLRFNGKNHLQGDLRVARGSHISLIRGFGALPDTVDIDRHRSMINNGNYSMILFLNPNVSEMLVVELRE